MDSGELNKPRGLLQQTHLTSVENAFLKNYENKSGTPCLENPFLSLCSLGNVLYNKPWTPSLLLASSRIEEREGDPIKDRPKEEEVEDENQNELEECSSYISKEDDSVCKDSSLPMEVDDYPEFPRTSEPFTPISHAPIRPSENYSELESLKIELLQTCATSLLLRPKLMDPKDDIRQRIIELSVKVLEKEHLFILKMSLYLRREMGLRDTSLLLLSFCCLHPSIYGPHFSEYFQRVIHNPAEWTRVPDFLVTFEREKEGDGGRDQFSLPSMLRKAMIQKFGDFDEHVLAKYQSKGRNNQKHKKKSDSNTLDEANDEMGLDELYEDPPHPLEDRAFNIKRLIRLLHIKEPSLTLMCILGKKYPESQEVFSKLGLGESRYFDADRAGKRLRLPIPDTWEAQISMNGNKAEVWHSLILKKKIPYLALIRNLRNIILSGINKPQFSDLIHCIKSPSAIRGSKIFPHQYLAAMHAIDKIENGRWRKVREKRRRKKAAKELDQERRYKEIEFAREVISAMEECVLTSFSSNMSSIQGKSLIFISNPPYTQSSLNNDFTRYGFRGPNGLTTFMSLIIAEACEDSKILTCSNHGLRSVKKKRLVQGFVSVFQLDYFYDSQCSDGGLSMLSNHLVKEAGKAKIDNIFILIKCSLDREQIIKFVESIDCLRCISNRHVNLAFLSLDGTFPTDLPRGKGNNNNVYISGSNTSALQTLSRLNMGTTTQVEEVDNIPKKYGISTTVSQPLPSVLERPLKTVKWDRVTIFVSSTFLDMFGERNLLNHCIFPVLKRRCRDICVEITPIDLRWGLPDGDSSSIDVSSTKYCLSQSIECDIFLGFLGERYGWKPKHNKALEALFFSGETDLLDRYKNAAVSLTELEIKLRKWKRCHFYFRDPSVLDLTVTGSDPDFVSQNNKDIRALKALKEDIRRSGCSLYENYRAKSVDKRGSRTVLTNFEDNFIHSLTEEIWKDILEIHQSKKHHHQPQENKNIMSSFIYKETKEFIGREVELKEMREIILSDPKEFKVIQLQGSGKTAFLCKLSTILQDENVIIVPFFSEGVQKSVCVMEYLEDQILQLLSKDPALDSFDDTSLNFVRVSKLMSRISSGGKIVVFILDGLPLNDTAWLPIMKLPSGVRILISTSAEDSILSQHLSVRRKKHKCDALFTLKTIKDVGIKKQLVKSFLKSLGGKVLSEAPLNNVLRLVASKRESGNVKYLKVLCSFLVSSDAIFHGQEKVMIQKEMPGNFESLLGYVLDRKDEDSEALLAILTVLIYTEGPNFDQLLRAGIALQGDSLRPMILLRALNRLDMFLEPLSHEEGYHLRSDLRAFIEKRFPPPYELKHRLYDHFTSEFYYEMKNSNLVHPYVLKSTIGLCFELFWTAFLYDLAFIYHIARHGPQMMEYLYYKCVQSPAIGYQYLNFLHFYSGSIVSNPLLTYQHGINCGLARDGPSAGVFQADKSQEGRSFIFLEDMNKEVSQRLINSVKIHTSFSKFEISVAAGFQNEDTHVWLFGSKDSIIVQLTSDSMYGLNVHSPVTALSFLDSEIVMSGLKDGSVYFWDIKKRAQVASHYQVHRKSVTRIFTPQNSRNAISIGLDGQVLLYSSSFGNYQVQNIYSYSLPLSSGIALNESSVLVGNWSGELLKINIISGIVLERLQLTESAVLDITLCKKTNSLALTDAEGYFYILNEDLCLRKWRRILCDPKAPTVLGNKIQFLSENEVLVACSDGIPRQIALDSYRTNLYEFDNPPKNHDFKTDHVVCMDSYQGERLVGYNSGWIRLFKSESSSYPLRLINTPGELSEVLILDSSTYVLVTNADYFISFRFDVTRGVPYDIGKASSPNVEYLNRVLPISREKASFIYPRKDYRIEVFHLPNEPNSKMRKRTKVSYEVKNLKPVFVSELLLDDSSDDKVAVAYEQPFIFACDKYHISIWRYSEIDHTMEKLEESTYYHYAADLIVTNTSDRSNICTLSALSRDEDTYCPHIMKFNLDSQYKLKYSESVHKSMQMNDVGSEEVYFYWKENHKQFLSRYEFYEIICNPSLKLHYCRNGQILHVQEDKDEKAFIIMSHPIDHIRVKASDMSSENILLSMPFSPLVYLDDKMNVCSTHALFEIIFHDESDNKMKGDLEEKKSISSILPILGGDDRDWIVVSGSEVELHSLSSGKVEAKRKFYFSEEVRDFTITSISRSMENGSLTLQCFSNSELFSIIVDSRGEIVRNSFWLNEKKDIIKTDENVNNYYSDWEDNESISSKSSSRSRSASQSSKSSSSSRSRSASQSSKSSSSSRSRSASQSSSSSRSRSPSQSSKSDSEHKSVLPMNGLIGVDWNQGYRSGLTTLGFEDGSLHSVDVNCPEDLEKLPRTRNTHFPVHFFHPLKDSFLVDLNHVSVYLTMRGGNVHLFGTFDGRIFLQSEARTHHFQIHQGSITSIFMLDEDNTFASLSRDGYLKIWRLEGSSEIKQIGEFLSNVPLLCGGFSKFTRIIILGGELGILHFLKIKNCILE